MQFPGFSPRIQDDPSFEWLAASGYHNRVMLLPRIHPRNRQVQFHRSRFKSVQFQKEIVRPMKTKSALPETVIDHHIMKPRRAHRLILLAQFK